MATEIERKFLVVSDSWRAHSIRQIAIQQVYLCRGATTVRVRRADDEAWLTIKGPTTGISRSEFEYRIPLADAEQLLTGQCQGPLIEKTRHWVVIDGHRWEVDEFIGANAGLVLAELELSSEDARFSKPEWLGREVSADPRHSNSALSLNPLPEQ